MTPQMTIILPHQLNAGNNAALDVCIDCLTSNTRNEFNILISAAHDQHLYECINRLFAQATTDCCVYWNSDMFAAPGWDVPMLQVWNYNTIVTPVVVEPGAISIHPQNHLHDFGRKPWAFQRTEFEDFAAQANAPVPSGEGWYAPYMMSRQRFLDIGCIEILPADFHGFNARPLDIEMFERHKANGGVVKRAVSYVYHLQRWSDEDEQNHPKRDVQS